MFVLASAIGMHANSDEPSRVELSRRKRSGWTSERASSSEGRK